MAEHLVVDCLEALPEVPLDIALGLAHHEVVYEEPPGLHPCRDVLVHHHLAVEECEVMRRHLKDR